VEAARTDLEEVVRSVLPGSTWYSESTTLNVRAGEPALAILAAARECDAALIVMGTRGRGAVGRAVFGSTTAQVLRDATLPVAIVPPDAVEVVSLGRTAPIPNFGVILVPLDLSERSAWQLLVASRLSTGSRHRLLLLHVAQPGSDPATVEGRLTGLAGSLGSAHGERIRIREGPVAETIALAARKKGAGLIVLGRDRTAAGAIACELLRHTRSLVVVA
jgi:nucleotide-binding universal stress UspA family protein